MSVHYVMGLRRPTSALSDRMKRKSSSFNQHICAVNRYSNSKDCAHNVLPPAIFRQIGSNGNATDFYSGGALFESSSSIVRRD
jgi:hypothetical protein